MQAITLCPERTEYKNFITTKQELDKKEYKAILRYLKEKYVLAFHNYVAEVYPYLRFEVGEEKVFWNYNTEHGVYEEIAYSTVREMVLKLLIDEGLNESATDGIAKNIVSRYRACYAERGNKYDAFDTDDTWFHADNGWVNLATLAFTPHTPERLSRIKSAVVYNKDSVCPIYDKFLDVDVELKQDQVRVIDQFSGLCLTNDIKYQKMLTLIGRAGSGKSTLLEIWSYVLGDKSTQKKLTELSGDAFRFAGSSMLGRTLCWFDEVDVKKTEMSNSLGTLITGEGLSVERKGVNGILRARNCLKCVLTANNLPTNSEHGMYRRLIYIPFNRSFYADGTQDTDILSKMKKESSGVLNRMIMGLHDLRKMGGFTVIAGHEDIIEEYKIQSDTIAEFLDTYFDVGTDEDFIETDIMLASYKHLFEWNMWVKSTSPQKFGRMIKTQPLNRFGNIKSVQKYGLGRGWSGLKIKDEYDVNVHNNTIVSKISQRF